ncbi:MAG: hypothetical protein ABSG37_14215, partial [Candidatus Limnocylindrales bacterium]
MSANRTHDGFLVTALRTPLRVSIRGRRLPSCAAPTSSRTIEPGRDSGRAVRSHATGIFDR